MPSIPESIGKYRITRMIAQGGMSAVYKAVHPTLKRNVILKKLTIRGSSQFIERFKREARIMMDFKHDGIVTVYDHFKEGQSYYIVLEYVDGFSLDELIRRRRSIPDGLGLYIFLQVCSALKYAHDSGVIHRDIKPSNILISKEGEVKLVDFGIAGCEEDRDEELTAQGTTLGTFAYMPPEQFKDTRNVDKCADIYAMGVMLYEMATGKKPFPGSFSPNTLLTIQKGKYVSARKLNPKIDKTFSALIRRMIQPKKERRFQDLEPAIRILRRRLKREDQEELKARLVAAMSGVEYKAPPRKKRRAARRFAIVAVPLLLFLSAGAGCLYLSGKYFEWLRPLEYGKLKVEARFAAGAGLAGRSITARLLPLGAAEGGAGAAEARQARELRMPGFVPAMLGLNSGGGTAVSSGELYLESGEYLLELTVDERQYSESFYLPPFGIQAAEGRPGGLELAYDYPGPRPRPLTLTYKVLDARMGRDITDIATLSVRDEEGYWVELGAVPAEKLLSGRNYAFQASAPGYAPRRADIAVGPLRAEAFFQASLLPIEGWLSIGSSLEGLSLTINGAGEVLSGGDQRKLQRLRLPGERPLELSLVPSRVRIEARAGFRSGAKDITVESGRKIRLTIEAGRDDEELSFVVLD